jgi:hypothetical protein
VLASTSRASQSFSAPSDISFIAHLRNVRPKLKMLIDLDVDQQH